MTQLCAFEGNCDVIIQQKLETRFCEFTSVKCKDLMNFFIYRFLFVKCLLISKDFKLQLKCVKLTL